MGEPIVAVFVAHFHTREGNIIEWQYPEDVDLSGVEFKAIASGCHQNDTDFIYFKHADYYGLACFHKLSTSDLDERNARMRSVGCFVRHHYVLRQHQSFLLQQAALLNQSSEAKGEADFSPLVKMYESSQSSG